MPNLYVWRAALFVSLGAAFSGYYDGSMNGILEMEGFQHTFHHLYGSENPQNNSLSNSSNITDSDHTCSSGNGASSDILIGMVVSVSALGSTGGSLIAGWLSDQFSRKYGLLVGGLVITVGCLILSASFHIWLFMIGRGIGGIAIGITYVVMPMYISEFSPKDSRGMLTSLIGISYAGGVLAALCSNIGFSKFPLGWRVSTSIQALLGLLFSLGMIWMPHTPRWLVLKHRDKEAHLVLSKINHHSQEDTCMDTHFELEELKEAIVEGRGVFKEVFKWKYMSRLLLMLLLFFIFSAVGNFLYYFTATLFCGVGVSPFFGALAVGLIMLVASVMLPIFIDRVGRKALLLSGSTVGMTLITSAATVLVLFDSANSIVSSLVVAIICCYAFTNSFTWLTIPFIITSEIFPVHIRGLTVAVVISAFWFFSFLVNQVIPLVLGSPIQTQGFFYIVAGVNLFSIVLVAFALPETKGVSLEQMDELFSSNSCMKQTTRTRLLSCCSGGEMEVSSCEDKETEAISDSISDSKSSYN